MISVHMLYLTTTPIALLHVTVVAGSVLSVMKCYYGIKVIALYSVYL